MTKVLGISGSLRRGSYNSALLRAAARLMPAESALEIASIRGIPLFDGDVEAQGMPATVAQLKEAMVAADGVLLVTPEYNNGLPGVFKNAIDWLSRPAADIKRVFGGRHFAVIGASPGAFGTVLSQAAWLPVLRTLGTQPWSGRGSWSRGRLAYSMRPATSRMRRSRSSCGSFSPGTWISCAGQRAPPSDSGQRRGSAARATALRLQSLRCASGGGVYW